MPAVSIRNREAENMNATTRVNDTYVWVEVVLFSPRFYPSVCETREDSWKSSVCLNVIESTAWMFRRAPEAMCLQSSLELCKSVGKQWECLSATRNVLDTQLATPNDILRAADRKKPALPENF